MKNNNVFNSKYIFLDETIKNQKDAFEFIAKKAVELDLVTDQKKLVQGYIKREKEGSTGFEDGFAIPHARIKEVKKAAVFVVRFKKPIDWNSMDGKPTKVAIALLIPDDKSGDEHLTILSSLAVKLMDEDFKTTILNATKNTDVLNALTQTDKAKEEKVVSAAPVVKNSEGLNILAITACTTGVAHTYMAEEKLLKEVKLKMQI